MTDGTDTAIEALTAALAQLKPGTPVHNQASEAHQSLVARRPHSAVHAYLVIEQALFEVDTLSPVQDLLMQTWAAVRPSPTAIPIEMAAEYVWKERVRLDDMDRRGEAALIPGLRDRVKRLRFVDYCLCLAERARVGAVLASSFDDAMLLELEKLYQQLYWQNENDRIPGRVAPRHETR
ncbi:hypothetical protein [Halofilum ochraceum]|uniref:hypothetical protein n=1 Tax=Halofilum ochraceum TaxID=1611323 RepID=UPI0008DAC245|nr:hypothetical protein [Halofilum ochraceum]